MRTNLTTDKHPQVSENPQGQLKFAVVVKLWLSSKLKKHARRNDDMITLPFKIYVNAKISQIWAKLHGFNQADRRPISSKTKETKTNKKHLPDTY